MLWKRSTLRWTAVLHALALLLVTTGSAGAEPIDPRVASRFTALTKDTVWTPVAAVKLRFRTFHPQGMVKIGDDFFISSVEIRTLPKKMPAPRDGHAYDTGVGIGHLFKVGPGGALLADLVLGEWSIYHPGGIDYDGTSIWVPVAEYRPDSRSIIYKVTPETMKATVAFRVADHIGGVVHDPDDGRTEGLSWGSRGFYSWPTDRRGDIHDATVAHPIANPEHYIDYQDCHYVGGRRMLCSGLGEYRVHPGDTAFQLGGVDLVSLASHHTLWQVPIALWAPSGRAMTQNPFWIEATDTGLRAYFIPDDDDSTLFVFDTMSP